MKKEFVEKLPPKFKQIILGMPHLDGKKWLNDLPELIDRIEKKWSIKVESNYPNLSYNYVAPGRFLDGREAVVKIGMPENNSELFDEARILGFLNGSGAVKLFEFDRNLEVIILERIIPGKGLKQIFDKNEEGVVGVAVGVLKKFLRKPPPAHKFPKLETWIENFERDCQGQNIFEFEKASAILGELNSEIENHFILHADFHHDNILSSERDDFLTIDPNGMIGHIGYDIAVFLNNHAGWINREKEFEKSLINILDRFSEAFSISSNQLKTWAYSQQVLSAFWELEDNMKGWKTSLEFAEIWNNLKT